MTTEQQYIASLDIEASYNLAKQMEAYRTNPVLGYRPAGSKAEFETGEMLKSYMEDLGCWKALMSISPAFKASFGRE